LFGDECLRKVAQVILRHTQRPGDVAVRFGGEEFVVLLPGTDQQGALRVAEAIRQDVARIALQYEGRKITLTISIGVLVKVPSAVDSVDALLELADAALYQAKENGRNRVEVA
jgi:diguanylate cyclase